MEIPHRLRAITYLSPGIPLRVYEEVLGYVAGQLGVEFELQSDATASGPASVRDNPFTRNEVELGFMCTPPYLRMRALQEAPIRLLGAAPVFATPRNAGEAVFYSTVIVSSASQFTCFDDLEFARWAYNDKNSLSGFYNLYRNRLRDQHRHFAPAELLASGSHHASVETVVSGVADAAAIDSNVLHYLLTDHSELQTQIRAVDHWGPFPAQPVVVRSNLNSAWNSELRMAFLSMSSSAKGLDILTRVGLGGFTPINESHYHQEALDLNAIASLMG